MTRRQLARTLAVVGGALALPPLSVAAWEAGLRNPVLRTISPNVRTIPPTWQDKTDLPPMPWTSFAGDPSATNDSATWRTVGVMAITREALFDMLGLPDVKDRQPVALFQTGLRRGRMTEVGGWQNLGILEQGNTKHFAVGFLIGPNALNTALAAVDDKGGFYPARHAFAYDPPQPLTVDSLPHDLPDVPVLMR